MEERRSVYMVLVGKPERKRPLGMGNNIKMDLQELGYRDMDWIEVAQDRDRSKRL
jgi:hypothetical protein